MPWLAPAVHPKAIDMASQRSCSRANLRCHPGIFTLPYTPSITHIAVYVDRAPTALFHHAVRLTFCVLASPPRPSGALSCGN